MMIIWPLPKLIVVLETFPHNFPTFFLSFQFSCLLFRLNICRLVLTTSLDCLIYYSQGPFVKKLNVKCINLLYSLRSGRLHVFGNLLMELVDELELDLLCLEVLIIVLYWFFDGIRRNIESGRCRRIWLLRLL